ncbi:LLM class flavin-dependent oxidoreductase [Rhodococcus sp. NBC_00297]|uniref:LLM class flavin-dependent oxidoreductase n=1 Tax=Rhodococcus sp. NBC_00297 TaxID=2976005 RepID=UPI002E29C3F7|nr:LLM class flavin-dependent oxidoreductase [Rhodococcus sp. NBC_00297]
MQYGLYVPNYGGFGSVMDLVGLAQIAEQAGWDGFFIYDTVYAGSEPVADAQIAIAGMVMRTSSIKLGALVTPMARTRPWKMAREISALSALSGGRIVAGVGLGMDSEYAPFNNERRTARERGALVDDNLDILRQLLSGRRIDWTQSPRSTAVLGRPRPDEIHVEAFRPTPVTRVPLWGAATLVVAEGSKQPMRAIARASGLDGIFPIRDDAPQRFTPDDLEEVLSLAFKGKPTPPNFDVVVHGEHGDDPGPLQQAGATWWMCMPDRDDTLARVQAFARSGPPR